MRTTFSPVAMAMAESPAHVKSALVFRPERRTCNRQTYTSASISTTIASVRHQSLFYLPSRERLKSAPRSRFKQSKVFFKYESTHHCENFIKFTVPKNPKDTHKTRKPHNSKHQNTQSLKKVSVPKTQKRPFKLAKRFFQADFFFEKKSHNAEKAVIFFSFSQLLRKLSSVPYDQTMIKEVTLKTRQKTKKNKTYEKNCRKKSKKSSHFSSEILRQLA